MDNLRQCSERENVVAAMQFVYFVNTLCFWNKSVILFQLASLMDWEDFLTRVSHIYFCSIQK